MSATRVRCRFWPRFLPCRRLVVFPNTFSVKSSNDFFTGASANRATTTKREEAALPSDAATDPDFGGPGGMALWRPTESPAFASAYAHRGEHASSHPCRTAESPLGRTSARPGGFVRRDAAARGAERRCRTRALSRVRRIFDTRTHRRALCASVKNLSGAPAKCGSGEHRRVAPMTYRRTCTIRGCARPPCTTHVKFGTIYPSAKQGVERLWQESLKSV